LRGSLSIALALSLPLSLPYRAELILAIFGTVVFSLLAQGLTITPLLAWLGMRKSAEGAGEYEVLQGRLLADTAALAELDGMRQRGLITARVYDDLKAELTEQSAALQQQLAQHGNEKQAVEQQQEARLRHHLISVRKARLAELKQEGILSEASFNEASQLLDEELANLPAHH
jgi:CPA1 family monovalent cation:H+ antiporter